MLKGADTHTLMLQLFRWENTIFNLIYITLQIEIDQLCSHQCHDSRSEDFTAQIICCYGTKEKRIHLGGKLALSRRREEYLAEIDYKSL